MKSAQILTFSIAALLTCQAAWGRAQTTSPSQVVVLKNQVVICGKLTHTEKGIQVVTESGSYAILPANQIAYVAESLDDAYQQMVRNVDCRAAADLMRMFEWCLKNQLMDRAADLLDFAATARMDSKLIDQMQRQIEDRLRELSSTKTADPSSGLPPPAVTAPSAKEIEAAIDGLPDGAEAFFNQRLHAKLIAGCAAAQCHHRQSRSFPLYHDGQAVLNPRGYTRRNLFEILQWIDREHPGESPVLKMAAAAHGGQTRASFDSTGAAFQLLQYWSYAVSDHPENYARDMAGMQAASQPKPATIAPRSPDPEPMYSQFAQVGYDETEVPSAPPQIQGRPQNDSELSVADPCDAQIFNRKYHPDRLK